MLYLIWAAPLLFLLMLIPSESSTTEIYCGIEAVSYLSGKYNPSELDCFADPAESGVPTKYRKHYMRKEAVKALASLYKRFRAENPDTPFFVRSSTRTYNDQLAIWNAKWKKGIEGGRTPSAALKAILRYSAMPGTSRHHWGTDFDINELDNAYYDKGHGKVIYDWMVRNASQYGFCMPYTGGRKEGYAEERWHWSYRPLSLAFILQWNFLHADDPSFFYEKAGFGGYRSAAARAPIYVNSINGGCL